MKVISVVGTSKTGKTTTVKNIIAELTARGYSVGSVKEIHYDEFAIDTEGKNTFIHKMAGANPVTALANRETDIMFCKKLDPYKLLSYYDNDYVILEGVRNINVPYIVTAKTTDDLVYLPHTFAICGVISNTDYVDEIYPVINATTEGGTKTLVDLIEKITPPLMCNFDKECCSKCGKNCSELLDEIIRGEAKFTDCALNSARVSISVGGKELSLVDFVANTVYNVTVGMVKELKGYDSDGEIVIKIKQNIK